MVLDSMSTNFGYDYHFTVEYYYIYVCMCVCVCIYTIYIHYYIFTLCSFIESGLLEHIWTCSSEIGADSLLWEPVKVQK